MRRAFLLALLLAFGGAAASHALIPCTQQCSNGYTLSCNATTSCNSGSGWIQCDGGPQQTCPVACTARCPNNAAFGSCTSYNGDCEQGWDGFTFYYGCDGFTYSCPSCPNHQIRC